MRALAPQNGVGESFRDPSWGVVEGGMESRQVLGSLGKS